MSSRQGRAHRSARRTALFVVLFASLGAAAAVGVAIQRGTSNSAAATILLNPLEGNAYSPGGRGDDLLNMQTEARLVASDNVARRVIETLDLDATPEDLAPKLDVANPPNTQILRIGYAANSSAKAVEFSQAFAQAFLDYRQGRAEALVDRRTALVDDQIKLQNEQLQGLVSQQADTESDTLKALLAEQIDVSTALISSLNTQRAAYQSTPVDPGQFVTPAAAVSSGPLPKPVLFGLIGAIFGAALALAPVLARARAGNRGLQMADIRTIGADLLGNISEEQAQEVRDALGSTEQMQRAIDSDFKALRATVLSRERRRPVAMLLASVNSEMGMPTSGLGLAHAFAQSHVATILVDATGTRRGVGADLGLADARGLTEVLTGSVTLDRALTRVGEHLAVLPSGRGVERFEDLIASPQMSALIIELTEKADVVMLVTGSVYGASARAVSSLVDNVIVEAAEGLVRVNEITELEDEAQLSSLLGLVYVSRKDQRPRRRGRKVSEETPVAAETA